MLKFSEKGKLLAMEPCTSNGNLPPGICELISTCFAPGVKGYFERKTILPLLESTKRFIRTHGRADRLPGGQNVGHSEDSKPPSLESLTDYEPSGPIGIVHATWETVFAFMEDEKECLENGQSTQLFEDTISQRRSHFKSKKRTWMRDNDSLIHRNNHFNDKESHGNGTEVVSPANTSSSSGFSSIDSRHFVMPNAEHFSVKEAISKLTVLEKVRFLVGIGLENIELQDEIYCQILKQLVCNPSQRSSVLGWILLSLVCGCFAPTKQILPHVEKFLVNQNHSWSRYCREKLTKMNRGENRLNPPCSLELQAAKLRLPIRLPVVCMDHSVRTVWAHSHTSAWDMCQAMAAKNRMGDSFGFSLFLALNNKLVTLGNTSLYIMDAISHAEEYSRQNDLKETFKIYFRREFFSPLDACGIQDNQMKAWLTYSQICGGVQCEEYICQSAQDLALLVAHQYYVRHKNYVVETKRVQALCEQSLPLYEQKEKKRWCQMVASTIHALKEKNSRSLEEISTFTILQQVISYASKAFLRNFTKTFLLSAFEPLEMVHDPGCKDKLRLRINHERMAVLREESVLADKTNGGNRVFEVAVASLKDVELLSSSTSAKVKLTINGGNTYYLMSVQAEDIYVIVKQFLEEIRSNSRNESEA